MFRSRSSRHRKGRLPLSLAPNRVENR